MVKVTVHLNDGTVLEETVEAARGSEKNFASPADIAAKFQKLAGKRLPPAQCARIMDLVLGLDGLSDVGELVKALTRTG
jgi:aconitate decarboxylase